MKFQKVIFLTKFAPFSRPQETDTLECSGWWRGQERWWHSEPEVFRESLTEGDTELVDREPVFDLDDKDGGRDDNGNDNLVSLDSDGDGDKDGGWEKDVGGDEEDQEQDKVAGNLNLIFEISQYDLHQE